MSSGQYLSAYCKKKNLERILEYALKIQKGQLDLGSVNWVILNVFLPSAKKKKKKWCIYFSAIAVCGFFNVDWTGKRILS